MRYTRAREAIIRERIGVNLLLLRLSEGLNSCIVSVVIAYIQPFLIVIGFICSYSSLLFLIIFGSTFSALFLSNEVHKRVLEVFLFFTKSILFPGIVEDFLVEIILFHALLPDANSLFIVWRLIKLQVAAELHELLELDRVSLAELAQGSLTLLFLDIVVFLVL